MTLNDLNIDKSWTLFLDRDGVINKKIDDDYVKHWMDFEFLDGVLNNFHILNTCFARVVVVTNQQGIGKGLYRVEDLELIHKNMVYELAYFKAKIDKIYFSPYLVKDNHPTRKPGIGMALQAQKDFPEIDFSKSMIVGDSLSDMEFGRNAGMKTVYIHASKKEDERIDIQFSSLLDFINALPK